MDLIRSNMNTSVWNYIGITIIVIDIIWIVFYYYYATVKVYNFQKKIKQYGKLKIIPIFPNNIVWEREEYKYLGYLWIRKKNGQYYLKIPEGMIEDSITTKYKIISQSVFHQLRKGKKIYINFADKYDTEAEISAQITVKNYIATSHRL